ncbi:uncharacterized protein LOC119094164 [Pollicipes pollicipes]|uniref:uncharacterized protein LOC119094164 n=1 Tax=Pollicipes pollicipes TaxID=41117 RepID=UPI0018853B88|nr:uncharacterized protein LOC119094164 [Pollicipes pollicipes]
MASLQEEYDAHRQQLAGVLETSQRLLPGLRAPDRLTLTDSLATLNAHYGEVGTRIEERAEAFRSASERQQAVNTKIASSVTYLTEIKKEIRTLNKPMGSGVEDAQGILSSYEEVLQKLREFRNQLESLQDQTVGSITDLNDLIRQQDELVRAIENQVSKLRNLVLLRQQFLHLLTEITAFLTSHADIVADVERTERPVPDKIRQYTGVLAKVQDIEALLAAAQDKGQQISEEGTVSDRNAILKQLQSLKQQMTSLKRAVETKRRQYEETAERHAALTQQVATELDWLHEREAVIRSRPVLSMDDAEIHRHSQESLTLCDETLPALERLQQLVTETEGLGPTRELPAGLQQQLSQARRLLHTLPGEMAGRQTYLQEARRLFDQYRSLKQTVSEWARDVGERVEEAEACGDTPQRHQAVSRCQALMADESARRAQVAELHTTVDRLLPLLAAKPRAQLDANQRQLMVSYDAIVLRAQELLDGCTEVSEVSVEAVQSKVPLLSELQSLVDATDGGQEAAGEADRAQAEWRQMADRLDVDAATMDDMIRLWQTVERELLGLESAADAVGASADALRPADGASDRQAQTKQAQYLGAAESPAVGPLSERTERLGQRLDSVTTALEERCRQLEAEAAFSEQDPYSGEPAPAGHQLQDLQEASDGLGGELTALCDEVAAHYEHGTPRAVAAQVSRLELLWDGCRQARADLESEAKRASQVLADYASGLEEVTKWIGELESRLCAAAEPVQLRALLEELQGELAVTSVRLADVTRLAGVITERARQPARRATVQQAVQHATQELEAARGRLEKRRLQVLESLESWSRFIDSHDAVRDWMKKQHALVREPKTLNTLMNARDALNEYKAAVKECKWATRKLHEMATELSSTGETSSVDALTERMSACEHDKIETETLLKERMSLLLEMTEEWEQCERKMREVQAWCQASRASLESQQARKRPLRDQLAFCEKMSSDNGIQRTRLAMAVDKLGVHFRSGYFAGASVVEERRSELESELRQLQTTVDEQCRSLAVCVSQLEQYQQDVQTLRARILEIDQQLRTVSQPAHVARDRDVALAQQRADEPVFADPGRRTACWADTEQHVASLERCVSELTPVVGWLSQLERTVSGLTEPPRRPPVTADRPTTPPGVDGGSDDTHASDTSPDTESQSADVPDMEMWPLSDAESHTSDGPDTAREQPSLSDSTDGQRGLSGCLLVDLAWMERQLTEMRSRQHQHQAMSDAGKPAWVAAGPDAAAAGASSEVGSEAARAGRLSPAPHTPAGSLQLVELPEPRTAVETEESVDELGRRVVVTTTRFFTYERSDDDADGNVVVLERVRRRVHRAVYENGDEQAVPEDAAVSAVVYVPEEFVLPEPAETSEVREYEDELGRRVVENITIRTTFEEGGEEDGGVVILEKRQKRVHRTIYTGDEVLEEVEEGDADEAGASPELPAPHQREEMKEVIDEFGRRVEVRTVHVTTYEQDTDDDGNVVILEKVCTKNFQTILEDVPKAAEDDSRLPDSDAQHVRSVVTSNMSEPGEDFELPEPHVSEETREYEDEQGRTMVEKTAITTTYEKDADDPNCVTILQKVSRRVTRTIYVDGEVVETIHDPSPGPVATTGQPRQVEERPESGAVTTDRLEPVGPLEEPALAEDHAVARPAPDDLAGDWTGPDAAGLPEAVAGDVPCVDTSLALQTGPDAAGLPEAVAGDVPCVDTSLALQTGPDAAGLPEAVAGDVPSVDTSLALQRLVGWPAVQLPPSAVLRVAERELPARDVQWPGQEPAAAPAGSLLADLPPAQLMAHAPAQAPVAAATAALPALGELAMRHAAVPPTVGENPQNCGDLTPKADIDEHQLVGQSETPSSQPLASWEQDGSVQSTKLGLEPSSRKRKPRDKKATSPPVQPCESPTPADDLSPATSADGGAQRSDERPLAEDLSSARYMVATETTELSPEPGACPNADTLEEYVDEHGRHIRTERTVRTQRDRAVARDGVERLVTRVVRSIRVDGDEQDGASADPTEECRSEFCEDQTRGTEPQAQEQILGETMTDKAVLRGEVPGEALLGQAIMQHQEPGENLSDGAVLYHQGPEEILPEQSVLRHQESGEVPPAGLAHKHEHAGEMTPDDPALEQHDPGAPPAGVSPDEPKSTSDGKKKKKRRQKKNKKLPDALLLASRLPESMVIGSESSPGVIDSGAKSCQPVKHAEEGTISMLGPNLAQKALQDVQTGSSFPDAERDPLDCEAAQVQPPDAAPQAPAGDAQSEDRDASAIDRLELRPLDGKEERAGLPSTEPTGAKLGKKTRRKTKKKERDGSTRHVDANHAPAVGNLNRTETPNDALSEPQLGAEGHSTEDVRFEGLEKRLEETTQTGALREASPSGEDASATMSADNARADRGVEGECTPPQRDEVPPARAAPVTPLKTERQALEESVELVDGVLLQDPTVSIVEDEIVDEMGRPAKLRKIYVTFVEEVEDESGNKNTMKRVVRSAQKTTEIDGNVVVEDIEEPFEDVCGKDLESQLIEECLPRVMGTLVEEPQIQISAEETSDDRGRRVVIQNICITFVETILDDSQGTTVVRRIIRKRRKVTEVGGTSILEEREEPEHAEVMPASVPELTETSVLEDSMVTVTGQLIGDPHVETTVEETVDEQAKPVKIKRVYVTILEEVVDVTGVTRLVKRTIKKTQRTRTENGRPVTADVFELIEEPPMDEQRERVLELCLPLMQGTLLETPKVESSYEETLNKDGKPVTIIRFCVTAIEKFEDGIPGTMSIYKRLIKKIRSVTEMDGTAVVEECDEPDETQLVARSIPEATEASVLQECRPLLRGTLVVDPKTEVDVEEGVDDRGIPVTIRRFHTSLLEEINDGVDNPRLVRLVVKKTQKTKTVYGLHVTEDAEEQIAEPSREEMKEQVLQQCLTFSRSSLIGEPTVEIHTEPGQSRVGTPAQISKFVVTVVQQDGWTRDALGRDVPIRRVITKKRLVYPYQDKMVVEEYDEPETLEELASSVAEMTETGVKEECVALVAGALVGEPEVTTTEEESSDSRGRPARLRRVCVTVTERQPGPGGALLVRSAQRVQRTVDEKGRRVTEDLQQPVAPEPRQLQRKAVQDCLRHLAGTPLGEPDVETELEETVDERCGPSVTQRAVVTAREQVTDEQQNAQIRQVRFVKNLKTYQVDGMCVVEEWDKPLEVATVTSSVPEMTEEQALSEALPFVHGCPGGRPQNKNCHCSGGGQ